MTIDGGLAALALAAVAALGLGTACDTPAPDPAVDMAPPAPCDRARCAAGCCDADGRCRRDDDDRACGLDARACVACGDGETCRGGVCLRAFATAADCDPQRCAGCCRGHECVTTPVDAYCGAGGGRCVVCGPGETCTDGACVVDPTRCGPTTCDGCCIDGHLCHDPPTDDLCGSGGLTCENCPEGGYRACVDGLCVR